MLKSICKIVGVLFVGLVFSGGICKADFGSESFAIRLNASGGLFHDSQFVGAEVVYRSSGIATKEAAIAAWMKSPGHRALVGSGKIQSIACVGNVCVGRGVGYLQSVGAKTTTCAKAACSRANRFANRVFGRLVR